MPREIFAHYDDKDLYFANKDGEKRVLNEGFGPYEYLLGALSGCYYYTLCDIAEKSSVTWKSIDIHITGEKRTTVPTTLEDTTLQVTVTGASDEHAFTLAAEKASKTCSIFQTISKVSNMHLAVVFK